MINQVILSICRKLSAHLLTTCIFCILILVVLIGGLIQVISSLAFSAYLENSPHDTTNVFISSTSEPMSLVLDGEQTDSMAYSGTTLRFNKTAFDTSKLQNGIIHASLKTDRSDKSQNGRSYLNTKILYTPYNGLSDMDKLSSASMNGGGKSKQQQQQQQINSTVYKSVTPSITDRVIADLKKEEYLNQQRSFKTSSSSSDGIEVGENDEAIYIDGDEEESNTPNTITEIETSVEKLPVDDSITQLKSDATNLENVKSQKMASSQTIGVRDKKSSSSKKPSIISQKYKNFGFVDTDSSEAVDIDDDDYDDYFNSGSGDFNNQLIEQQQQQQQQINSQDWIAPTIEKIKAKKLNKQERILKSFADNSYGISDSSSKEVDTIDALDFVDKDDDDDDQMISRKIAKAHKKQKTAQQKQQQKQTATKDQKSKTKQNNRQKSNTNNKRKSKEQRYIDEYFSGTNTGNSAEGAEAELVKNGWMEPRIRRILGNIKKSEERSQQILLCKGEGELCSMLFKTPIKPVATP